MKNKISILFPNFFHFKIYGELFIEMTKKFQKKINIEYYKSTPSLLSLKEYSIVFLPIASLTKDLIDLKNSFVLASKNMTLTTQIRSNQRIENIQNNQNHIFLFYSALSKTTNRMVKHLLLNKYGFLKEKLILSYNFKIDYFHNNQENLISIAIAQEALKRDDRFPYVYDAGALWKNATGCNAVYGVFIINNITSMDFFKSLLAYFNDQLAQYFLKQKNKIHPEDYIDNIFNKHCALNNISKEKILFFFKNCIEIVDTSIMSSSISYFYRYCNNGSTLFL